MIFSWLAVIIRLQSNPHRDWRWDERIAHNRRILFYRCNLLLFTLLILSACSPLPTTTPPPTPQAILLTRPAALSGWDAKVYSCAQTFPQLAVFVEEQASASPNPNIPALALHFGALKDPASYSYIIAYEDILLVTSQDFPRDDIELTQLHGIFTGQLADTQALDPASDPLPIQAWTYPISDETRQLFDESIFPKGSALILALIALDPSSMLEALTTTPASIGYLPASALSLASAEQASHFKVLTLIDGPAQFSHQPVIAQLSSEPSALMNAFMQCLEKPNQ